MDLRRQQQDDVTMPFSLAYNPPIRESSSKVSSSNSVLPVAGAGGDRSGNGNAPTSSHHNQHGQLADVPNPLQRATNQDNPISPNQSTGTGTGTVPFVATIPSRSPEPTPPKENCRYRECLKNHAASIGGHILDGCGEFMPGGEDGTPEALKCAACDCHRSFHRKEIAGESHTHLAPCHYCYLGGDPKNGARIRTPNPPPLPLPAPIHHHKIAPFGAVPGSPPGVVSGPIPGMMVAFGGGSGATDSSSDDLTVFQSNATTTAATAATAAVHSMHSPQPFSVSKKRFRTKFTQEQKDKMLEFAEKVGWKMQKQDEAVVEDFCAEVGVKRQVLKVWMHNNKHALRKRDE